MPSWPRYATPPVVMFALTGRKSTSSSIVGSIAARSRSAKAANIRRTTSTFGSDTVPKYCGAGIRPLTRGDLGARVAAVPELPTNSELTAEILREPDGVRLLLGGELDMNGVIETERAVQEAAADAGGRLTIDLDALTFMDLFGARALLRVADEVNRPGREVVIVNPRRHVRRLFELITDLAPGRNLVGELVRRN